MPRLPKGIFQRGGTYYCRIRVEGRQHRKWVRLGRSREEARLAYRRLQASGPVDYPSLTVAQLAREWLELYVRSNRKPKGHKDATRRIERYLVPFMGQRQAARLSTRDCWAYKRWVERKDISPATVAYVLGDLRSMMLWAEGMAFSRSPVPRRFLPKLKRGVPRPLTDGEVELVTSVPDPWGFTCRLALATGMRFSELCRAQASDVLTTRDERGQVYKVMLVGQTKSGRPRRIPLPPPIAHELSSRVGRLVPYSPGSESSFARTVMRKTDNLERERTGTLDASGVRGFHAHRLRHTYACRFIARGGSLAALQKLLGHADLATTQIYAEAGDDVLRREVLRVHLAAEQAAEESGL